MNIGYLSSIGLFKGRDQDFLSELSLMKEIHNLHAFVSMTDEGLLLARHHGKLELIINHTEGKQTSRMFLSLRESPVRGFQRFSSCPLFLGRLF
jgi:hypothetical protein